MGPRIFGIAASAAPVVAILRRGPTGWAGVGRWDVREMTYEQGAWLRGTIYPQRCDVSPDGTLLAYFALKASAEWEQGATYVAISKLPWLTALASWGTAGTWTRGIHFVEDTTVWRLDDPDGGDLRGVRGRFGLAVTAPATYAVERRRGWSEAPGTPPRGENDVWDEKRSASLRLQRPRPGDDATVLEVTGEYAAFRAASPERGVSYNIGSLPLPGVQWADWSDDGRLLVATAAGELQARGPGDWSAAETVVADLSALLPESCEAPPEAHHW